MDQNRLPLRNLEQVCRASHSFSALIQHMGADHRGTHVLVPEQLRDGSNIVALMEEVRAEESRL